jgi:hypothetical protein
LYSETNGSAVNSSWKVNQIEMQSYQCAISSLNNDNYAISWTRYDSNSGEYAIYANIFNVHRQSISEFEVEFLVSDTDTDGIYYSAVSNITNDTFVIAWKNSGTPVFYFDILARAFWNNGTPIGEQFKVDSFDNQGQFHPSIIAFVDIAYFVISWTSEGQDDDEAFEANMYAQIFDSFSLVAIGGEFIINTLTNGRQTNDGKHALAIIASNSFVVVWGSDTAVAGVYAQRFVLDIKNLSIDDTETTTTTVIF